MYRHIDDDIPYAYPLSLNGMGEQASTSDAAKFPSISDVRRAAYSKPGSALSIYKAIDDLYSFGAISEANRDDLNKLVAIDPATALKAIRAAETRFLTKGSSTKITSKYEITSWLDDRLPEGYKLNQRIVQSLPNYALYAIAGAIGIFAARSLKKRN